MQIDFKKSNFLDVKKMQKKIQAFVHKKMFHEEVLRKRFVTWHMYHQYQYIGHDKIDPGPGHLPALKPYLPQIHH